MDLIVGTYGEAPGTLPLTVSKNETRLDWLETRRTKEEDVHGNSIALFTSRASLV